MEAAGRRGSGRGVGPAGPPLDLSAQGGSAVPKWVLIGCAAVVGSVMLLGCVFGGLAYLFRSGLTPDAVAPAPVPQADPTAPVRRELVFGDGHVYWSDDSLSDEARKLGEAMRETGYFNGKGEKGVELARAGDTRVVTIYLRAADIGKPATQAIIRDYAGVLWAALAFEGKPVVVKLCDETKAERFSYPFEPSGRYPFGRRGYVYHPAALRADAERFGRHLARTGALGVSSEVTLAKNAGKWSICFGVTVDVVTEEVRQEVKQVVRQVSDEVFAGRPVEMLLFTKQGVEVVSAGR